MLVLGATNRPQAIDAALLRPGRFDVHLYVPPPDLLGRMATLQIHSRKMPLANDVDLQVIQKFPFKLVFYELFSAWHKCPLSHSSHTKIEEAISVLESIALQ